MSSLRHAFQSHRRLPSWRSAAALSSVGPALERRQSLLHAVYGDSPSVWTATSVAASYFSTSNSSAEAVTSASTTITVAAAAAVASEPSHTDTNPSNTHAKGSDEPTSDKNYNSSSIDKIKEQLFQTALLHVPEHGWTTDAIATAAATVADQNRNSHASGVASSSSSMAMAGLITVPELVAYGMQEWNDRLRRHLIGTKDNNFNSNTTNHDSTTEARIAAALEHRLRMIQHLVQANRWHDAMAIGVHPGNASRTQAQLAELVDIVLQYTNNDDDKTGNLPSWTDRLGLGAVYMSAELFYLTDQSPDHQETWDFLRQRVRDWERLRHQSNVVPGLRVPLPPMESLPHVLSTSWVVGSSLASGAYSVLFHSAGSSGSGDGSGGSATSRYNTSTHESSSSLKSAMDGSHPSHYEAPQRAR